VILTALLAGMMTGSLVGPEPIHAQPHLASFDLTWGSYGNADGKFRLPEGLGTSSIIDWTPTLAVTHGWQADPNWQLNSTNATHSDTVVTNVFLTSPRINLFDVPKPIALTFDYSLDPRAQRAWLEISVNGSTWFDLHPGSGQSLSPPGGSVNIDLSDYAFSIIQIRWGFTNTDITCGDPPGGPYVPGNCTNYYQVQNVKIKGGINADDQKQRVYVADTGNHRVQIFKYTADGSPVEFLGNVGSRYGNGNGEFNSPEDVVVGPNAIVYVADTGNHRIQYFNADGSYIGQWGSYGNAQEKFNSPSGVAASGWHLTSSAPPGPAYVADYFYLYIVDTGNHRIQQFQVGKTGDGKGTFVRQWGSYGNGDGKFRLPEGIDVDPIQTPFDPVQWEAHVYVADAGNHRVQYFKLDGTFTGKFGVYGNGTTKFNQPQDVGVGIRLDGTSTNANRLVDVYVADTGNHRVQYFDGTGSYQNQFGRYGNGSGQFNKPAGIAVDRLLPSDVGLEGDIFVIDTGNHRGQRFSRL
jgi:hypothetical protein